MKFIVQCGREPALSLSEIFFLAQQTSKVITLEWYRTPFACFSADTFPDFLSCDILGGAICVIEHVETTHTFSDAEDFIVSLLNTSIPTGKIVFGLHGWFGADVLRLTGRIKDGLSSLHRSSRFIRNADGETSVASILHNDVLASGCDIHVFNHDGKYLVGKTLSVQNIDAWSKRDFSKPGRDAKRGMLPPKLARMMVNMSGTSRGEILCDPFCGVGTILMESALLGFQTLGSDADPLAVDLARKNMIWLSHEYHNIPDTQIIQCDAREIARRIKTPVGSVVTETFLGNVGMLTYAQRVDESARLLALYLAFLKNVARILPTQHRVVMAIPLFVTKQGFISIDIIPQLKQCGFARVDLPNYVRNIDDSFSPSGNLLYGRENQRVWREILILERL